MSYSQRPQRDKKSRPAFGHEEVKIPIPKDKVGLVIGRKGQRLQEIRDRTGVQISIKDEHANLRGTAEQCQNATTLIEELLNVSARHLACREHPCPFHMGVPPPPRPPPPPPPTGAHALRLCSRAVIYTVNSGSPCRHSLLRTKSRSPAKAIEV